MEYTHVDRALMSVRPAHDVGKHDEDQQEDEREECDEAQQGAHGVELHSSLSRRGKYMYRRNRASHPRARRTDSKPGVLSEHRQFQSAFQPAQPLR
jgi:hypothetical protein